MFTGGNTSSASGYAMVVAYSTDCGSRWTRCQLSGSNRGFCHAIAVAPSQPEVLYAGGEILGAGALFRSTNLGRTWIETRAAPGDTVLGLAVHPTAPELVYAATPSGLSRTTDGGESWENLHQGERLRAVALFPAAPDTVFAAGERGVDVSFDQGRTWNDFNSGLLVTDVSCLDIAATDGVRLHAGTIGGASYAYSFETGVGSGLGRPTQGLGSVAPVPARAKLSIRLSPALGGLTALRLWDSSGRLVWTCRPHTANGPLELPGIPAGVYQLELLGTKGASRDRVVIAR